MTELEQEVSAAENRYENTKNRYSRLTERASSARELGLALPDEEVYGITPSPEAPTPEPSAAYPTATVGLDGSRDTSTRTPGPMVELTAVFFT